MKRYAVCGVSNRAIGMFIKPILTQFADAAQLVGLLDKDPLRFDVCQENVPETKGIPTYGEDEFDRMVAETKPDAVIVASADYTHARYVLAALAKDLDALVEKPMTTTAADARRILDAEAKSKGKVIVTFNYRYPSHSRLVKEQVLAGRVGRITSVDLNWQIDTYHGASYFMRWNRKREFSGGLSIHKCSHHFDLLNWWIDQEPVEVFAYGALNYYGANGEMNPERADGRKCATCPVREKCAYIMRWQPRHRATATLPKDDHLGTVKRRTRSEAYTDYRTDQCIFDSEINIEDTYTAVIRYSGGAMASYSANFSQPYEGFRLAINGTKGRVETTEWHAPSRVPFKVPSHQTVEVFPLFGGAKESIVAPHGAGGHGGGDPLILEDLFIGPDPRRPYAIQASSRAGALAVAVGEAVWKSVKSGQPVKIADLL